MRIEERQVRVDADHGDELSGQMRIRAFVQILPGSIRDDSVPSRDAESSGGFATRSQVYVEYSGPSPMDVGLCRAITKRAMSKSSSQRSDIDCGSVGPFLEGVRHEGRQEGHWQDDVVVGGHAGGRGHQEAKSQIMIRPKIPPRHVSHSNKQGPRIDAGKTRKIG